MKIPLSLRSVISIHGKDSPKFLNGICTQVIPSHADGGRYAAFLSPHGRMLYDTFIYPTSDDSFLLDVDKRISSNVLALCKKYQLRSKVRIKSVDDAAVYSSIGGGVNGVLASMPDPRVLSEYGLGERIIASTAEIQDGEAAPHSEYLRKRYALGVPEGIDDIWPEKSLPLECNLDYMNGVNFKKGCYVGQELTIRTQHTGVVRKRVLPMTLSLKGGVGDASNQEAPPPTTNIYAQLPNLRTPKQVGKVGGMLPNADGSYSGVGLLRLEMLVRAPHSLFVKGDGDTQWQVRTQMPTWWPSDPKTDGILREAEGGGTSTDSD